MLVGLFLNQGLLEALGSTPLFPKGSKYPIFEVSGSKNHTLNGIRDQNP